MSWSLYWTTTTTKKTTLMMTTCTASGFLGRMHDEPSVEAALQLARRTPSSILSTIQRHAPDSPDMSAPRPSSDRLPTVFNCERYASIFWMLEFRSLFASPTPWVLGLTGQHLGRSDGTLLRERAYPPA